MLVEPTGLAMSARRLTDALAVVAGDPVHPPLGADPASVGAAQRLSTTAATLAATLTELAATLAGTAEQLGLVASGYVTTDAANAQRIANLGGGAASGLLTGSAPPAPPLPADLRAPLPPMPTVSGEAISAAVHAGDPAAGQGYSASWSRVASAAGEAAETIRSVIGRLPELLDSPNAAPAVSQHLSDFASTFESASRRAAKLASQAEDYATLRAQAGEQIPKPPEFAEAKNRWQVAALNNARSGGTWAVPLAQAESDLTGLNTRAVSYYGPYLTGTDAATGGDPSADADDGAGHTGPPRPGDAEDVRARMRGHSEHGQGDGATGAGATGAGGPGSGIAGSGTADGAKAPESAQLAQMMSSMIPAVMGAAGGLLGGLTTAPEQLMQGGMQAMQQLSSIMSPKPDAKAIDASMGDPSLGDAGLGDGGSDGAGGGEVTPMGGGPMPSASTTPSTGPPPTPPSIPAGSGPPPAATIGGGMGGGMPMGMPLGGMAHGGGGGGGKGEQPPSKKIVQPPLPHTEAVTGKVSADRMAISSISPTDPNQDDDPPGGPQAPVVRRITMPPRTGDP